MMNYCFSLMMAFITSFTPLYAMHSTHTDNKKQAPLLSLVQMGESTDNNLLIETVKRGLWGIFIGCQAEENDYGAFADGIRILKRYKQQLKKVDLHQLQCSSEFFHGCLKGLVLKGELELLVALLRIKNFPSNDSPNGINFVYNTLSKKQQYVPQKSLLAKQHTLLEVAYTNYVTARANGQPGTVEQDIMQTLIKHGAETYKNISKPTKRPICPATPPVQGFESSFLPEFTMIDYN